MDTAKLIGIFIALISLIIGLYKYLDSRNRELAWKKTEFLFEQARYLDNDKDIIRSISLFQEQHYEDILSKIYGDNYDEDLRKEYQLGFEKLLNFLDRLAHAYLKLEIVGKEKVTNFGWYLEYIESSEVLNIYCVNNGYEDVINLANEMKRYKYI